eukprot:RCo017252
MKDVACCAAGPRCPGPDGSEQGRSGIVSQRVPLGVLLNRRNAIEAELSPTAGRGCAQPGACPDQELPPSPPPLEGQQLPRLGTCPGRCDGQNGSPRPQRSRPAPRVQGAPAENEKPGFGLPVLRELRACEGGGPRMDLDLSLLPCHPGGLFQPLPSAKRRTLT